MSHTPRKSRTARNKVLTGCGALLALVAVGACTGTETTKDGKPAAAASAKTDAGTSGGSSGGAQSGQPGAQPSAQSSQKPAEEKEAAIRGSGTFQVPGDVKPGTYRTTGNKDLGCYWERAKDSNAELESIIANDNVTGASYVTIEATDKIFKSSGCKDWEAVDPKAAGAAPKTEFSGEGGMYKVGSDIAPGTYKSTGLAEGAAGCYWERSKSADHELDSIIANENPEGPAVVTISAKDAYFKTTGCATWKKS
ncbi:hypothetical protein [Streptomyces sp. Isolate_45]|uniref:hypothetical protein n=1 Tax=Streptomyces sp. Isolate_45 TaxID=2950111 RepID=UPI002481DF8D|nr:hypothetical protein [Streptomyces sp. Isolate_45]MDA5278998.1 hypothetical protein [Streptomyces sp. Isolate_45]